MRIQSRLELLGGVRDETLRRAARAGFDDDDAADIALCVSEAVANAIQHGNRGDPSKSVHVKFHDTSDEFAVEIRDEGAGIPVHVAQERSRGRPDNRGPGRGLWLMLGLMDVVEMGRDEGMIRLTKRKPRAT